MREAKVIGGNGITIQVGFIKTQGTNKVNELILQVPEELHETEETVAYIPAKSVWLNTHSVKELRDFLNEMYEKESE